MTNALKSLMIAGFTAILATAANAQDVDWTKVDAALGRKAAVTADVHRYGFPRTDLERDARRRDDQARAGPGRMGRVQADARRRDGHGRSCAAGNRDQSGDDEDDRERAGDHGDPQSCPPRVARRPSTCTSAGTATPRSLRSRSGTRWPRARRRCRLRPPPRRLRPSISTPRRSTRSSASRDRPTAASTNWPCRARDPVTENGMQLTPSGPARRQHRHRLPADRRRQGRDHRRLRDDRDRGQSRHQGAAAAGIEVTAIHSHMLTEQPRHDLHAFLGQRRRHQARPRLARRARQDGRRQELTKADSAMRTLAVMLVLLGSCCMMPAAPAAQSDDCKLCREDYQACVKAHSRPLARPITKSA